MKTLAILANVLSAEEIQEILNREAQRLSDKGSFLSGLVHFDLGIFSAVKSR